MPQYTAAALGGKVGCNTVEYTTAFLYFDWLYYLWGAGMAQWWECTPPPMWPRFDSGPVSYVGWVCCWFSSLLREFFSRLSGFPPSQKNSKFQFDQDRGPAWKPAKADVASSLNYSNLSFFMAWNKMCCHGYGPNYKVFRPNAYLNMWHNL